MGVWTDTSPRKCPSRWDALRKPGYLDGEPPSWITWVSGQPLLVQASWDVLYPLCRYPEAWQAPCSSRESSWSRRVLRIG